MGKATEGTYMLVVYHDNIGGSGFFMRVADFPTRQEADAAKAAVEKGTLAEHVSLKVKGPDDLIP
ncbi:hypothetical protein ES707_14126 [subsurface metagenome]